MGKETNISWTDATWNVARGCTKVNDDCLFCYMMRDSMNGTRYNPKAVVRTKTVFDMPNEIEQAGTKVFVSSLTDWGHEMIDGYRDQMWNRIYKNDHLIYQMLTKRYDRLYATLPDGWFSNPAKHVWLGVSAGSQKNYDRAMSYFREVPAAVKWVSLEPLHAPIHDLRLNENGINWVVVGGESGNDTGPWRYRPCDINWILDIVIQCRAAGVPVFVKQLGTWLAKSYGLKNRNGGKIDEWAVIAPELQIREFPNPDLYEYRSKRIDR